MKISIASDIHLEFHDLDIVNTDNADVLILAGDICIAKDLHRHPKDEVIVTKNQAHMSERAKRYRNFFARCSEQFERVIYVAGNHEFYHGKFYASLEHLKDEMLDNIIFLEDDSVIINNIRFMGSTLWTNMNRGDPIILQYIKYVMNDFRTIGNERTKYPLRPLDAMQRHIETLAKFKEILKQERQTVVITHHAPTFLSVPEVYKADIDTNYGYASDLSEFILDHSTITNWFHGHMHSLSDYMVGSCRVVANPRGYPGECPDWQLKTIEV